MCHLCVTEHLQSRKSSEGSLSERGNLPIRCKAKALQGFNSPFPILFLSVDIDDVTPSSLYIAVTEKLPYQLDIMGIAVELCSCRSANIMSGLCRNDASFPTKLAKSIVNGTDVNTFPLFSKKQEVLITESIPIIDTSICFLFLSSLSLSSLFFGVTDSVPDLLCLVLTWPSPASFWSRCLWFVFTPLGPSGFAFWKLFSGLLIRFPFQGFLILAALRAARTSLWSRD